MKLNAEFTDDKEAVVITPEFMPLGHWVEIVIDQKKYLAEWNSALGTLFLKHESDGLERVLRCGYHELALDRDDPRRTIKLYVNRPGHVLPNRCELNLSSVEPGIKARVTAKAAGGSRVSAPMNGAVLQVQCAEGQKVTKGEQLLTIEAMKMENPILAPQDGIVHQLGVKVGANVATGDLLCEIKPE